MRIPNIAALLLLGLSLPSLANPHLPSPSPDSPRAASSRQEDKGPQPMLAPPATRGQLLYENHCQVCHQSLVHIRARTLVRSLAALRMQVVRWSVVSRLRWSAEEIEEVVNYLNAQFYRFDE